MMIGLPMSNKLREDQGAEVEAMKDNNHHIEERNLTLESQEEVINTILTLDQDHLRKAMKMIEEEAVIIMNTNDHLNSTERGLLEITIKEKESHSENHQGDIDLAEVEASSRKDLEDITMIEQMREDLRDQIGLKSMRDTKEDPKGMKGHQG